jgi:hypothetical protein
VDGNRLNFEMKDQTSISRMWREIGPIIKNRRRILSVLGLMLLAGVIAIVWTRPREPRYKGKTLTEWFEVEPGKPRPFDFPFAVRHMGTNCLPVFVKWVGYDEPEWKRKLRARLSQRVQNIPLIKGWLRNPSSWGVMGFILLGEKGTPAIPALKAIRKRNDYSEPCRRASMVLTMLENQQARRMLQAAQEQRSRAENESQRLSARRTK